MKKILFVCLFFAFYTANAALEFTVSEKGQSLDDNNTVLIFGGMQGDEPGGFHAASLLISDYNITKGKIIVAPNLAFDSIIKRTRSIRGDLNRKFAELKPSDPDYKTVQRIKDLVLLPEVSMVINLHDGWGFYNPNFINQMQNPKRWGNSSVIDTSEINASKYQDLENIAKSTVETVNSSLVNPKHQYYVKNTRTEELDDTEMLKALTYFVISNNKAAFANEASKNLPVNERVYYHLVAIENYLKTAGIEFERGFELSPKGVQEVINKDRIIRFFGNKTLVSLNRPRPVINYFPTPLYKELDYETSNEITAVVADTNSFFIQYGNNFQTRLFPEYLEFSDAFEAFKMIIDGEEKTIPFASKVQIKKEFIIPKISGVRVNVIGLDLGKDESGILVTKNKMQPRFSLDLDGKMFRVEFYELRTAHLPQQLSPKPSAKRIKNPPQIDINTYNQAMRKDKFLGSILIEFE